MAASSSYPGAGAGYSLLRDASLRERNTLRVDARADWLVLVREAAALPTALTDARLRDLPVLVLGEGSNVLFAAERVAGAVVQLTCNRVQRLEDDADAVLVRAEAGHGWDALVDWSLGQGLAGLENLALIPGQAGAAPIQNIGAYGAELAEFVECVETYDRTLGCVVRLAAERCGFAYRDSVFKHEPERHVVTAVELRLSRRREPSLAYAGLKEELAVMGGVPATPPNVAEAVRRLRRRKLPDPARIGNAGSFFKNPVVPAGLAAALTERLPGLPVFAVPDPAVRKLSAAWLIELAGWRGFREGDAGVSAQHALVLVNHGGATGAQLLAVARRVADSVASQFGVRLEPEPRIVGALF
jgi:UDP-N-acetylmuramate dehydrogenase